MPDIADLSRSFTFPKHEKLCSEKITAQLFKEGKTEFLHPFKVFFLFDEQYTAAFPQVLFTVPKRQFKRAVDRNLIRRRCREAYRLNKYLLSSPAPPAATVLPAYLGFVYIAKEKLSFQQIEKKLVSLLKKITASV